MFMYLCNECKNQLLKHFALHVNILKTETFTVVKFPSYPAIKFSSILEKSDVQARNNCLITTPICFVKENFFYGETVI